MTRAKEPAKAAIKKESGRNPTTGAPPIRRETPWRAPKSGGYQVKDTRREPREAPTGRAGTSQRSA